MDIWEGKEFIIMLDFAGRIAGRPAKLPPPVAMAVEAKMGRPFSEACSPQDAQRIDSVIKTLLKGQSVGPTQAEFNPPSGERIESTLRFELLKGPDDSASGIVVFGTVGEKSPSVLGKLSSRTLAQLLESARNLALIAEPLPLAFHIAASAKLLAKADCAALYLKDEITGLLRVMGHADMPAKLVPKAIHVGEGLIGQVTERGDIFLGKCRPDDLADDDPVVGMNCRSYLYVPLHCEGVKLGALCVFAKEEARFADAERELIVGLAEIAAAAILRTRSKKGLTQEESLLRTALDGVTVGILATDHEGRIAYANPEYLKMSKARVLGVEDLIGRNVFSTQIVLKNHLSDVIVSLLAGESFDYDRPKFFLADDSRASIRIQGRALSEGSRVFGGLLVIQELFGPIITEMDELTMAEGKEPALTEVQEPATGEMKDPASPDENYWAFFEESGDGILIFSDEGDIIDLNDAAAKILDLNKKEILGAPLDSIFSEKTSQDKPARTEKYLAPEKSEGKGQLFFGAPGFQKRILVAEDDRCDREFCRTTLDDGGYEVIVAEDGQEALDIFKAEKGRFDLVMLDMVMPELNGESTARKMRVFDPEVRVILCTGYAERIKDMEKTDLGPLGFVEKPYEAVQLLEVVAKALAKADAKKD